MALEDSGAQVGSVVMLDTLPPERIRAIQAAPTADELFAELGLTELEAPRVDLTFAQAADEIRTRAHLDFVTAELLEAASERVEKLARMASDHEPRIYRGVVGFCCCAERSPSSSRPGRAMVGSGRDYSRTLGRCHACRDDGAISSLSDL